MITSTRVTITFVLPEDAEQLESFKKNMNDDWMITETSSCVSFVKETVSVSKAKE